MPRTLLLLFLLPATSCFSQNIFKTVIKDKYNNQLLPGAIVKINENGKVADEKGSVTFFSLADTAVNVEVSYPGYETQRLRFLLNDTSTHIIFLPPEHNELGSFTIITPKRINLQNESLLQTVEFPGKDDPSGKNIFRNEKLPACGAIKL